MQVRVHLLPGQGSIGTINPRGLNALVNSLDPTATVYMTASKNDEKFRKAREVEDSIVIVVEVPEEKYETCQNKFGWKLLRNVEY